MNKVNDLSLETLFYRRLTDSQLDTLHHATLQLLEEIGIRFRSAEALEIFEKGGATVAADRVCIPSWRVEWALQRAPKRLTLFDQTGRSAIRLEGRCSYFGNGSDLLYIIDHRSNERRAPRLQDVVDITRLIDKLDNLDFIMSGFLPKDVPVEKAELLQMETMLQYTDKPIVFVTTDLSLAQKEVAMAEAVAGGPEELRRRPFAACYINIANPLHHNPESIKKLIWLSRKGLPFTYRAALVTRGVSTPQTGAGFLVVQNAATLAGLVLSQLIREGTPFIRDACAGGTFDMQYMVGQHAAPEIRGFNEDLLHYYGLPGFGIGGVTGSKTVDSQAALEAALTLMASAHAGASLVHDVGYMDNGVTGSLVQLAICDEIIGWLKAYMKPLAIDEHTIAMDTIREVMDADGDFLGTKNTAEHYKEDFYPRLLDRQNYDGWEQNGATLLRDRAKSYVEEVLSEPAENLLNEEQNAAIRAIVEQ
jgi:trimethylamine---corrinoid protein Co-methyltransferase